MENIHLKSADPISQAMLRNAALRGVELGWERSEKLQPQDGFLRLGLSCPYDCLLGPCRIDPFGRGADKGICGLDRDSMVAAGFYRLCHRGLLETLAAASAAGATLAADFPGKLQERANQVLAAHGLAPLSRDSLLDTVLRPHQGSQHYQELLLQALHLSLLSLGLAGCFSSGEKSGPQSCRSGYGVISGDSPCIGFCGSPSPALVKDLHKQAAEAEQEAVQLVALGSWIQADGAYLPVACSSGSCELLLSSGAVHLVVAGPDADPAIFQLCRNLDIPVVTEAPESSATELLHIAASRLKRSSRPETFSDLASAREFDVHGSGALLDKLVDRGQAGTVALVCGSDTPQRTLGKVPQELYRALNDEGYILGGWGDASWWIANGEKEASFYVFDPLTGPVAAVERLIDNGRFERLAGICFTGVKSCREFASAIGLAVLGCRVNIAVPIPLLGSQDVCRGLDEMLKTSGGELTYYDHPAETEELTAWFATQ